MSARTNGLSCVYTEDMEKGGLLKVTAVIKCQNLGVGAQLHPIYHFSVLSAGSTH